MKLIKYTATIGLLAGTASAQGLFDLNPNEIESESSPLKYTVGLSLGNDDNINPTSGLTPVDSSYMSGSIGANLVVRGPRTSWDINTNLGYSNYFDATAASEDTWNARLAFNFNHRINNRVRFVSRNFVNYGVDLGGFYGPVTDRQSSEFTYISTDQAVGYRWNDRLATYTGVFFSSLNYDGAVSDVDSYGVYNSFRYSVAPKTVATLTYRYSEASYATGDRSSQVATVGFEHSVSDTANLSVEVGAQFSSDTTPYTQISYSNHITNQLKARVYARYSIEDTDTVFGATRFDAKTTLRIGAAADYQLSEQVNLTIGGTYVSSDYEQEIGGGADGDLDLFNAYISAGYKFTEAVKMSASYNFTTSDSTGIIGRNYDRNRFQVSLSYSF